MIVLDDISLSLDAESLMERLHIAPGDVLKAFWGHARCKYLND